MGCASLAWKSVKFAAKMTIQPKVQSLAVGSLSIFHVTYVFIQKLLFSSIPQTLSSTWEERWENEFSFGVISYLICYSSFLFHIEILSFFFFFFFFFFKHWNSVLLHIYFCFGLQLRISCIRCLFVIRNMKKLLSMLALSASLVECVLLVVDMRHWLIIGHLTLFLNFYFEILNHLTKCLAFYMAY